MSSNRVVCLWLALQIGFANQTLLPADEPAADGKALADAREHLDKGRYAEALNAYQTLADSAETNRERAAAAIGISRVHEAEGRWSEATVVMTAASSDLPEEPLVWARLGELQFRQGQYVEAETSANRAIELDSRQPLARLVLADVYTETGRIKQANDAYRWFVRYYNQAQPTDAETLLLVARGSAQYARFNSVSQIFSFVVNTLCPDVLKDDPTSWQAHHLSGALLLEKYNRAQAIPELQQALAVNPRAADVVVALGEAALQDNDFDEALEQADRALAVNPQHPAALRLKADALLKTDHVEEALGSIQAALKVNPHDQRTLARLAAAHLAEDGSPPDAELDAVLAQLDRIAEVEFAEPSRFTQVLSDVATRNPRPGYFLAAVGDALESRKQYALAERLYRQAIELMPELAEPKTALGLLYMRTGRTDEAGHILDDAFRSDPYHVRVSNMRKVLRVLEGYDTISTEHFVIRADTTIDRLLATYMAEYLEEIYPKLTEQFGFEPPQRTQFEIYNKAKGLSGHEWFSARLIGLPWIQTVGASTGVIVVLASPTATDEPYNWARVVRHEFSHVITLQQTDFNIPHWFTEALAVGVEGFERPSIWNELLLERVPAGEIFTLENLNEGFTRPGGQLDWQFAYCQSRLYAEYMIEAYGAESIPKLLAEYRRTPSTEKAIPRVFGVELAEFEAGYRQYLDRVVAELQQGAAAEESKTLAELEKAHQADPDDTAAAAAYAHALLAAGERREARELAVAVLERDRSEPLAACVLAKLAVRAEDLEAAVEFLEPALDRKKPHPEVLELLAKLKLAGGDHAEAAALYELGRDKFPYDVEWLQGLVAVYLETNDATKLKPALEQLARVDFDNAGIRKALAELALDAENFAEAAHWGREALFVDVLDVEVHRILAEAHRGLKAWERAISEYEVALELKPEDSELEMGLARTYVGSGKPEAARAILQRIVEREPDNEEAAEALRQLQ